MKYGNKGQKISGKLEDKWIKKEYPRNLRRIEFKNVKMRILIYKV